MHVSDRLNNLNDLSPKFEGFFLEMEMPEQKQRVQEIVTEAFGLDWNVEQIGDNLTEFEVTLNKDVLSVKDAWDKSYYLRSQPGVVDAQPLFAVPLSDTEDLNQEPEVGMERTIDDQSTDVEWSLKQMRVFEAWSRFFPDPNRPPGHGVIIGLPDTGYTEHPEIIGNILVEKGYDFLKNDKDAKDELEPPSTVLLPAPSHGTYTSSLMSSPRGGTRQLPKRKRNDGSSSGRENNTVASLLLSYTTKRT